MQERLENRLLKLMVVGVVTTMIATSALGQGRGRGGGGGGGRGSGGGSSTVHSGGPPSGIGVDRGLGTASERSRGRSDAGLENASMSSRERSDAGLQRARLAGDNLRRADKDLRDHPGLARALHMNANDLRGDYQTALLVNPELKFGHFVSATRVAQNLNRRHPQITRAAILNGLASGRSLGQTLQDLGLSDREANAAKKRAEREMKQARE